MAPLTPHPQADLLKSLARAGAGLAQAQALQARAGAGMAAQALPSRTF